MSQKPETRAEAAHRINELYMDCKITREEWSDLFDSMSNPRLWVAEGRVVEPKKEPEK